MGFQFASKSKQGVQPKSSPSPRRTGISLAPPHSVLQLQRTIGNQGVLRLLKSQKIRQQGPLADTQPAQGQRTDIRQTLHGQRLEPKLTIGEPNDKYEQEADHVADQMMRTPEPQLQRACACGGRCPKCQAEQLGQEHERLQTKRIQANDTGQIAAPPIVNEGLRSPGQPLDSATKAYFEPRFGHDFSNVRVHSDVRASEAAQAVSAKAFTVGQDIVFGTGQYAPNVGEGRRLLAHELAHAIQQTRAHAPQLQRSLKVNKNAPSFAPANDPANSLTSTERLSQMGTLIHALCDNFEVDSKTGDVKEKTSKCADPAKVAAGSKPSGCCCLCVFTDPTAKPWTIEVSQVVGPHTKETPRMVVMSPTSSPIEFGSFTAANTLAFQGAVPALGHELCGHAALMELKAHPPVSDRTKTKVHDPTVRIENVIAGEQGVAGSKLRGLTASGSHRGESVDRITIHGFKSNRFMVSSLPAAEKNKIKFAADYIKANTSWVDVLGHSDTSGTKSVKEKVSKKRAESVKDELRKSVPKTITKFGLTAVDRFTRVDGLGDTQPPSAALKKKAKNWRRVDILMAGFPAGAQVPSPGTPTTTTAVATPPTATTLAKSPNDCVKLLVKGAYNIP